jgi:DNA-binding IclR family transcriptional regulator
VKSSEKEKVKTFYNRSLERALQILNALSSERPTLSLAQLSETLNLSRATVLRLCSTLINFGFLRQDPLSKHYSLGIRVLELAKSVSDSFSLRKIASSHLSTLQTKLGKTIFLAVFDKDELLYIDKIEDSRNPISFTSKVGTRRPPYWGMLGVVLMAYLPEKEIKRILQKQPLAAFTSKSITKKEEFIRLLREVRAQGYAVEVEMALDGITGIGVPIFDHNGMVMAAVGVGFISSSVKEKELDSIIKEATRTGTAISKELGYTGEER